MLMKTPKQPEHYPGTTVPNRMALNDKAILRLPLAGKPGAPHATEYVVRDTELKAFFVVIGRMARVLKAQAEVREAGKRRTIKKGFGRVGDAHVSVASARKEARAWIADIQATNRAPAKDKPGVTLAEAWELHRKRCEDKKRCERTIEFYEAVINGPLAPWKDTRLREFGNNPTMFADVFDRITAERTPSVANGARATFSAVYNTARKRDPSLPPNPVFTADRHEEKTRETGFGLAGVAEFGRQVAGLVNPIRQCFHVATLLTGSRPEALSVAKWEHINTKDRTWLIPSPKGGPARAFSIPLSLAIVRVLQRVRQVSDMLHPGSPYIFPAASADGHIVEWKEARHRLAWWGKDLRRSFVTIARELRIDPASSAYLVNHKVAGMQGLYANTWALTASLREPQSQISRAVAARLPAELLRVERHEEAAAGSAPALVAGEMRR